MDCLQQEEQPVDEQVATTNVQKLMPQDQGRLLFGQPVWKDRGEEQNRAEQARDRGTADTR